MLNVENISKTFNPGTINEKKALDGLSLHLDPGDFVTVIGGNGAGKSTLLNAIAGVWPVDSGRIVLDGTDVTAMPEHRRALPAPTGAPNQVSEGDIGSRSVGKGHGHFCSEKSLGA